VVVVAVVIKVEDGGGWIRDRMKVDRVVIDISWSGSWQW